MVIVRRSAERGIVDHGWLDSKHTFSFGSYRDPKHVHFRALRVLNEDRVAPGGGFPMHEHDNMEIFSYVLSGALAHTDSMGNSATIRAGDVQRMSAGTGVTHSEFNPSSETAVHFIQAWLFPAEQGRTPSYEQKSFGPAHTRGGSGVTTLLSPDGRDGSVTIGQDAVILSVTLTGGQRASLAIGAGRSVFVQVLRGTMGVSGNRLETGDSASITGETMVPFSGVEAESEALVFDLA